MLDRQPARVQIAHAPAGSVVAAGPRRKVSPPRLNGYTLGGLPMPIVGYRRGDGVCRGGSCSPAVLAGDVTWRRDGSQAMSTPPPARRVPHFAAAPIGRCGEASAGRVGAARGFLAARRKRLVFCAESRSSRPGTDCSRSARCADWAASRGHAGPLRAATSRRGCERKVLAALAMLPDWGGGADGGQTAQVDTSRRGGCPS